MPFLCQPLLLPLPATVAEAHMAAILVRKNLLQLIIYVTASVTSCTKRDTRPSILIRKRLPSEHCNVTT